MRLGILGGTFDPIHFGHLLLAEEARESLPLDRVLLVPAARPPHKPDRVLTPYALRLRMVELAVEGAEGLEASGLEGDARNLSYTVETLRRLRAADPGAELWLLLGSDSLEEIPTWRDPEEIGRLARFAVYPRPGRGAPAGAAAPPPASDLLVSWEAAGRIASLSGPPIDVSSTELRRRARAGRSLRFLVPEAVRRFIAERGLYREEAPGPGPAGGRAA